MNITASKSCMLPLCTFEKDSLNILDASLYIPIIVNLVHTIKHPQKWLNTLYVAHCFQYHFVKLKLN